MVAPVFVATVVDVEDPEFITVVVLLFTAFFSSEFCYVVEALVLIVTFLLIF